MTSFSIIIALLLVVAVLFVALPLLRSKVKDNQVMRNNANLEIFRDQIAEMDNDLRNGLLTQELYDQGKHELQARLLEDVNDEAGVSATVRRNPHKVLALVLAVLLPAVAIGLYWKVGNRDALLPPGSFGGQRMAGDTDAALKTLQDKLAVNPKDTDSLEALARLYAGMGRYADAAMTYNKLTKLVTQNAQLWADFADALAMASGQKLAGHPTMLIKTALTLDPNNPKALALAGSAAMEIGEYPQAIQYWEKLLTIIPKDTEDAKMFADGIQQARMAMAGPAKGGKPVAGGQPSSAPAGQERITGIVTLGDAMKAKVNPEDMLFVLARAESGPPMPLAVMRVKAKDLPLKFELNDSMAMAPQMKLSNFDKVVVVARIAKSGDPMPHPGDIQGQSTTIKPGTSGVKVTIDSEVK